MRALILVTGAPGTGKTSLARGLAARLSFPLVSKDTIKEALGDQLGAPTLAESRRLGAATYEVTFAIAREMDRVILESNFGTASRVRLLDIHPAPIEIFCRCAPETALNRYRARSRHPVHFDAEMLADLEAQLAIGQKPLDLGGPTLRIDTDQPPDTDAITSWIRTRTTI